MPELNRSTSRAVLPEPRQNVGWSSPRALSLVVGHPRGRDRCQIAPVHLPVRTARRGSSGGVPELNRSASTQSIPKMSMTPSEESTTKPVLARSLPALSCTHPQTQPAPVRGTQTATTPHSSRIERHTVRGWGGEWAAHRTGAAAGRADIALRRQQLPRAPFPAPAPSCAHVPPARYAQLSAEPADGSHLPPPPPPGRGAAAPSSPPPYRHFALI